MRQRVVITGVGLASPIGHSLNQVSEALRHQQHGIVIMPDWSNVQDLQTRLAAPAGGLDLSNQPRKKVRTMGRVARLAMYATEQAVEDAGLDEQTLSSGKTGLAYGSTHGSSSEMESFCKILFERSSLRGLAGSAYFKFMSHTCAANLAYAFGIRGRIIPTISACASSAQGIGYGYEAIRDGMQEVMLSGGAEEMHFVHAGVFDIMYAASTKYNDRPELTPRPFDADRDGLVVGEGAGTLVLENYERARARGAHIYAEVVGYGTNCDGEHIAFPSVDGMAETMRLALEDAKINSDAIDYVNGHGTATEAGDISESQACAKVLGTRVPISSTKGHTGHTLGACGAIEAAFCLAMMRDGFLANTRNLERVDPRCASLNYIQREPREARIDCFMSNNFAFGGINTSLIFKRV
jgi:3-oxoacyl-[acyl-carrier-protein] synthase II